MKRVPEFKVPTVTTRGVKGEVSLLTIVCKFITKAAAQTVASVQASGVAPCPALPIIFILNVSAAEALAPDFIYTAPTSFCAAI